MVVLFLFETRNFEHATYEYGTGIRAPAYREQQVFLRESDVGEERMRPNQYLGFDAVIAKCSLLVA